MSSEAEPSDVASDANPVGKPPQPPPLTRKEQAQAKRDDAKQAKQRKKEAAAAAKAAKAAAKAAAKKAVANEAADAPDNAPAEAEEKALSLCIARDWETLHSDANAMVVNPLGSTTSAKQRRPAKWVKHRRRSGASPKAGDSTATTTQGTRGGEAAEAAATKRTRRLSLTPKHRGWLHSNSLPKDRKVQHFIGGGDSDGTSDVASDGDGAKRKTSRSRKGSVADERNDDDVNDDDDEAPKQQRQMLAELRREHALELEQLQSEHAAEAAKHDAETHAIREDAAVALRAASAEHAAAEEQWKVMQTQRSGAEARVEGSGATISAARAAVASTAHAFHALSRVQYLRARASIALRASQQSSSGDPRASEVPVQVRAESSAAHDGATATDKGSEAAAAAASQIQELSAAHAARVEALQLELKNARSNVVKSVSDGAALRSELQAGAEAQAEAEAESTQLRISRLEGSHKRALEVLQQQHAELMLRSSEEAAASSLRINEAMMQRSGSRRTHAFTAPKRIPRADIEGVADQLIRELYALPISLQSPRSGRATANSEKVELMNAANDLLRELAQPFGNGAAAQLSSSSYHLQHEHEQRDRKSSYESNEKFYRKLNEDSTSVSAAASSTSSKQRGSAGLVITTTTTNTKTADQTAAVFTTAFASLGFDEDEVELVPPPTPKDEHQLGLDLEEQARLLITSLQRSVRDQYEIEGDGCCIRKKSFVCDDDSNHFNQITIRDDGRWLNTLRSHRTSGSCFEDAQFPPNDASLGAELADRGYEWCRVSDMFTRSGFCTLSFVDDDPRLGKNKAMCYRFDPNISFDDQMLLSPNIQHCAPIYIERAMKIAETVLSTSETKPSLGSLNLVWDDGVAFVEHGLKMSVASQPVKFSHIGVRSFGEIDTSIALGQPRITVFLELVFEQTCHMFEPAEFGDESAALVEPADINQGELGDCFLLCALSILSTHERLLFDALPDVPKSLIASPRAAMFQQKVSKRVIDVARHGLKHASLEAHEVAAIEATMQRAAAANTAAPQAAGPTTAVSRARSTSHRVIELARDDVLLSAAETAAIEATMQRAEAKTAAAWAKQPFSTEGLYAVRFWIASLCEWRIVLVDDYVPINPKTKWFAFSRPAKHTAEVWVAIVEKAYAKLCGSYAALDRGGEEELALQQICGAVPFGFSIGPSVEESETYGGIGGEERLWRDLTRFRGEESMVGLQYYTASGDDSESTKNGLLANHAYGVLGCFEMEKLDGSIVRMVQIRNPHGVGGEPSAGDWIDSDPRWESVHPSERRRVGWSLADNGTFLMGFHDVYRTWDKIAVSRPLAPTHRGPRGICNGHEWSHWTIHSEWVGVGATGYATMSQAARLDEMPQFELGIEADCELVLALSVSSHLAKGYVCLPSLCCFVATLTHLFEILT